jgi:hypothetical protein
MMLSRSGYMMLSRSGYFNAVTGRIAEESRP